jgi:hypothetical protein
MADEEELTPEQKELLEKAKKEAEEAAKTEFKGFNPECILDAEDPHGPRIKHNGILMCKKCDFIKVTDGKAVANPPAPKNN